jgi:hypothetical protein
VLAVPDEAFHLDSIMRDICSCEIPYERLSPIATYGQNYGDQLVCRLLLRSRLLRFLDRGLYKVLDENSMGDLYSGSS